LAKSKTALSNYVRELYQYAVLSNDEEEKLSKMIQAGDRAALDKLVRHNLRFVVSVVKETPAWHHGGFPFEDLVAMGNEGLLRAAKKWIPRNGARFATYAKPFIVKGVRRALDNESNMIRIPVNVAEEIRSMKYTERKMTQCMGREPTAKELADELVMHEKRVVELQEIMSQQPVSLEAFNQEKFQEERDD
jgi:RNA polymerase sigma factor (sigma-70 family)